MVVARIIVAIALACAVGAQREVRRGVVLDCSDLPALLAERHPTCQGVELMPQMQLLLESALRCRDDGVIVRLRGASALLVASSAPDQLQAAQRALETVRAGAVEVRVQCTVFTRPAQATDRAVGPVTIDEIMAGKLLKAALAAGGAIRNLPETGAPPLVPFVATARPAPRPGAAAPAPPATAADVPVRCVALVLGDDDVALTVRLDGSGAAPREHFIRAQVGTGALLTFAGATHTTCVWLRVVALRPIEPGSTPAPQPRPVK
jgi:hypothetical protein